MQTVPIDTETTDTMPEKPIDLIILQRLDEEQKKIFERLGKIEDRISGFGVSVGRIEGATEHRDVAWWVRYIVAPLVVAASITTVTTVIIDYGKVARIESFLHENGGFIAGLRLEKVNPSDAPEAEQVLAEAAEAKVKIPLDVIEETGKKFVGASDTNPAAWNVALKLLEYRTFLNSDISPFPVKALNTTQYVYSLNLKPNPEVKPLSGAVVAVHVAEVPGNVPLADSARIESLTKPQPHGSGVPFLIVDGRADIIVLDNEYLKNVVIRNAVVEYDGGPVRLENVYFVNCTLRWPLSVPARSLGQQLLANAAVNFIYSSTRHEA